MNDRRALKLLRNVYRSKGSMSWEWGGTYEAPEQGEGAVGIFMKCSACGAISKGMTRTCKACGRIDKLDLTSWRVIREKGRRYKHG